jgi:hypothetical protein
VIDDMAGNVMDRMPEPGNWRFWLIVALLVKVGYLLISVAQGYVTQVPAALAICSGDCTSYIGPIDNLVSEGHYTPDHRMPGYGALYLPFRWLFGEGRALDALVLLQVLLDALAVYVLARSVQLLTGECAAFHICFSLYGLASTVSGFNAFILTESLAASTMVIAFWTVVRYHLGAGRLYLVLGSALMTWAYFMRPILLPLTGVALVVMAVMAWRREAGPWATLVLIAFPVILIQGAWTMRNVLVKNKVFLLTETMYYPWYPAGQIASWTFVGTFDTSSALYFFQGRSWANLRVPLGEVSKAAFPGKIYTPDFNLDSLLELRRNCAELEDTATPPARKHYVDSLLVARFGRYTASIKRHHPFMAYVATPAMLVRQHVFGSSGVYNLFLLPFAQLGPAARMVKLFCMTVYLVALYGSLLFLCWSVLRGNTGYRVLSMLLLYGLLIHPVILRHSDPRYLYVFFPLMCIGASVVYARAIGWWRGRRSPQPTVTP